MTVSGFLSKCYKTYTCTGGQREKEKERGGRKAREGGVHRCRLNVIKCTRAPVGRDREGEGGRQSREACTVTI